MPFVGLMSKWQKRRTLVLAAAAVWMLCFHYVDLYWLIMPEIPHDIGTFKTYGEISAKYADTPSHFGNPVTSSSRSACLRRLLLERLAHSRACRLFRSTTRVSRRASDSRISDRD
jgi:hypothetical protein